MRYNIDLKTLDIFSKERIISENHNNPPGSVPMYKASANAKLALPKLHANMTASPHSVFFVFLLLYDSFNFTCLYLTSSLDQRWIECSHLPL